MADVNDPYFQKGMNWAQTEAGYFCPFRSVMSGVAGFGLGALMGLFLHSNPIGQPTGELTSSPKFSQTAKQVFKEMGQVAYSSGKSFAIVGAVYSGSECVIEGIRAKHDIWNPIVAGCFTGGAMSASGGPQAMLMGCAGFAAFSAAIEHFFINRSSDEGEYDF